MWVVVGGGFGGWWCLLWGVSVGLWGVPNRGKPISSIQMSTHTDLMGGRRRRERITFMIGG